MSTYSVKIRCFPPSAELAKWLEAEPTELTWHLSCGYKTEYARPITDENGREGVSVKLIVSYDGDNHPVNWKWYKAAGLEPSRVEFVRAVEIEEQAFTICYQCESEFLESQAWRDYDGDKFCSESCIRAFYDEDDEPYMKDPQGKVYNDNA